MHAVNLTLATLAKHLHAHNDPVNTTIQQYKEAPHE